MHASFKDFLSFFCIFSLGDEVQFLKIATQSQSFEDNGLKESTKFLGSKPKLIVITMCYTSNKQFHKLER